MPAQAAVSGLCDALEKQILDRASSASEVSLAFYKQPLSSKPKLFFQVHRNIMLDQPGHVTLEVGGGVRVVLRSEEALRHALRLVFQDNFSQDEELYFFFRQGGVGKKLPSLPSSLDRLSPVRLLDPALVGFSYGFGARLLVGYSSNFKEAAVKEVVSHVGRLVGK